MTCTGSFCSGARGTVGALLPLPTYGCSLSEWSWLTYKCTPKTSSEQTTIETPTIATQGETIVVDSGGVTLPAAGVAGRMETSNNPILCEIVSAARPGRDVRWTLGNLDASGSTACSSCSPIVLDNSLGYLPFVYAFFQVGWDRA